MKEVRFNIEGKLYRGSRGQIHEGDCVFDMGDNTHGKCDMIHQDKKHIAIRTGWAAEVGVPLKRVFKLKPYDKHQHRKPHTRYELKQVVDNRGELNVKIFIRTK